MILPDRSRFETPVMSELPPLPVPLTALRAFEAVARLGAVKAAAGEIGVTPSAISHQLRLLEESLGVDLLRRTGSGIELTEAGAALAPELTAGFSRIRAAVGGLKAERHAGPLRLSLLPTFAVHWLSPRLCRWPFARAGFDLLISTTQTAVDLSAGAADVAVRHGGGVWGDLVADRLFEESVTLYARPEFAPADGEARRRAIAGATLFLSQHRQENFARWNASLPGGPVRPGAVATIDSAGLGLRAAIDGAGVTLAGREIAGADVAAGRLVALFDHAVPGGGGYYLVAPPALARDRRVRALRAWLLAEARQS